jgi:hypothetical protein
MHQVFRHVSLIWKWREPDQVPLLDSASARGVSASQPGGYHTVERRLFDFEISLKDIVAVEVVMQKTTNYKHCER